MSSSKSSGISIHAPREGGDREIAALRLRLVLISIHAPREGGDLGSVSGLNRPNNFNPRPPRGGRPRKYLLGSVSGLFQSTPPARGATSGISMRPESDRFQSTPPARGATSVGLSSSKSSGISIHAPREGGDLRDRRTSRPNRDFNPRPPRGGRPAPWRMCRAAPADFNPRPPRGGRPASRMPIRDSQSNFNPRPPRGGRQRGDPDCR